LINSLVTVPTTVYLNKKEVISMRRHFHIINTKYFRIFFYGSYSLFEINVGSNRKGKECVLHLFTVDGVYNFHVNDYND